MNKIKKTFNQIKPSEQLEENILNLTVNKRKKNFKWAYALAITVIVILCEASIVYADEIKEVIKTWSTSVNIGPKSNVELGNQSEFLKIPTSALKSEENIKLNYEEVEKMLDTKFLNLENNNPDIYYSTGLNDDGKIGRIDLWIPEFTNKMFLFISMLNQNADEGYIDAFIHGLDASGDKKIIDNYKSNNLNTKVILYTTNSGKELTAVFVHNNKLYQLTGSISKEKMTKTIEKLK